MRRTTIQSESIHATPRADRHELRVTRGRDGTVVVTGDLDVRSAETLERALLEVESGEGPVIIDVREVDFMDSSGLRALVAASLRAGRRGTHVALRNARPELTRLLEITGLREQFRVPPSLHSAVR